MEALIALAVLAVLAGPVLAILALVGVRRLDGLLLVSRFQELTARLFALETQVRELENRLPARAPAPPEPVPLLSEAPPPPVAAAPPPPPAEARPPSLPPVRESWPATGEPAPLDIENLIAGRWFNRIGIVALLIAVSYFLKLAFDNDWIGHGGRVAIGLLLGALMLPWSHWLLKRGYTYFSEGITALGEATLFLSVWAGCQYYSLYSRDVGFAAMIVITAVMAAVAIGRDSQRIAVLSLAGGLLGPILASSGKDQQVVLFTYLLLLGASTLVIAAKKQWRSLAPIGLIGTEAYFWGWYGEFFHLSAPLERTVLFATLFFVLYSAAPLARALRGERLHEVELLTVLANELAYSVALFVLLWPDDKWPLTLLFVALAASHVAAARILPAPKAGGSAIARLLFAGLALTFLTLSIPIRLEGKWITLSFSVEGAALVWTGFRAASNLLRQAGYLMLAVAGLRLLFLPPAGGALFFNPRFAAYLVLIGCLAVALRAAQAHEKNVARQERIEVGLFAVGINVYALIALSAEFWDYFGQANTGIEAALAQHLSLSILWTAYATALLVVGVQQKSALLRWQSLSLFGLVVAKVFVYDLSFLEKAYKIFSFFVLGAVLLGVSFFYSRKLARERET
jgi:uncharacterized membrane protein